MKKNKKQWIEIRNTDPGSCLTREQGHSLDRLGPRGAVGEYKADGVTEPMVRGVIKKDSRSRLAIAGPLEGQDVGARLSRYPGSIRSDVIPQI